MAKRRSIKVYGQSGYKYQETPTIMLKGMWLKELGVEIGDVLYNCSAARPNIESTTNEEEIEVQTETLAITAAPLANGYVKARTGDSTTDTVYTGWYTAVYLPEVTPDTSGTQQSGQQGTDDETGGETL